MEIGYGFIKLINGKICKLSLEFTKSLTCVEENFGRIYRISRKTVFNKIIKTPYSVFCICKIFFACSCRLTVKSFSFAVAAGSNYLISQKRCNTVNICHKLIGIFENCGIYSLQKVTHFHTLYIINNSKSIIYMTVINGIKLNKLPCYSKIIKY